MHTGARRAARKFGEAVLRLGAPGHQVVLLQHAIDPRPRGSSRTLARMFAANTRAYEQTMTTIARATDHLGPDALPWSNAFLPPFDAASLYGLVFSRKPRLYLEIGSGNSTIFARRAISDSAATTRIVSIDPEPREEIDVLCDDVIREPLQDVEISTFLDVASGDVLFFDGTHQSFPNSDVTVFFTEILPSLPAGVVVGIHDIYLPDDYPGWAAATLPNEQYLLASWLLGRGNVDGVLLPCAFVHRHTELGRLLAPLWARIGQRAQDGGAFWFQTPLAPRASQD
jgi:predicted O-methyltransferase YrrM